jgi:hypothetical protein
LVPRRRWAEIFSITPIGVDRAVNPRQRRQRR